jgi:SAM-dependent methyltransferase
MNKFFFIMKLTFLKKSICRILQIWELQKYTIKGKNVLEIGGMPHSKNNFHIFLKKRIMYLVIYADKYVKNTIKIDLEKKNSLKKKFDNILVFNVLEHIFDTENSIKEMDTFLNKGGQLIGSTPFMYRIHYAPNDYLRFTHQYLEKILNRRFKYVIVKSLGFGPFVACYSLLFDFIKIIPFLANIFLAISIFLDFILSIFFKKNKLKTLYPVALFFYCKKK